MRTLRTLAIQFWTDAHVRFFSVSFFCVCHILMWIAIVSVASLSIVLALPRLTEWYAHRRVRRSKEIVAQRLREYETIAEQYTKTGTPDELRTLMGKMEEMMDELQVLEGNN